jgi:hypothetical protein
MMIRNIISILLALSSIHSLRAADFKADRDFLVVQYFVEHCAANVGDYLSPNASQSLKDGCSNGINTNLFMIWLMYFGPWKFDISKDTLVNKYVVEIRAKYRNYAHKGSLWDDPLNIGNMFDATGSHVAERLHNGTIPNFDAESMHTRDDYTKLVSAYHQWLDSP